MVFFETFAFGIPTTSTRPWLQHPMFSASLPVVTKYGSPELIWPMPLRAHPPARIATALLEELVYGDCSVNAAENAFNWLRSEVP